jgi:hypothetical protein
MSLSTIILLTSDHLGRGGISCIGKWLSRSLVVLAALTSWHLLNARGAGSIVECSREKILTMVIMLA